VREGGAFNAGTLLVRNTQIANSGTNQFSESLGVSIGTLSTYSVATGTFGLIAAGTTGAGALSVNLGNGATAVAGKQTGSVTVNFFTDGTGTSGLATVQNGSQTVNMTGYVYRLASGSLVSDALTLPAVREGTAFTSGTVAVRNVARSDDGYSEKLNVSLSVQGGSALVTVGDSCVMLTADAINRASEPAEGFPDADDPILAAKSAAKVLRIARKTGAEVIYGHEPTQAAMLGCRTWP
jgi:hypothetical protein